MTDEIVDLLNRGESIKKLTTLITTTYKIEEEGYILNLDARYGDGKTTFVKIWKQYLDSNLEQKDKNHCGHKAIYIDTWKYDFHTDPLSLICYELYKNLNFKSGNSKAVNLQKSLKKVVAYSSVFTSQFLKNKVGFDVVRASKDVNQMVDFGKNIFDDLENKINIIDELKGCLSKLVKKLNGKNLFIFIDELDRARPDYAVNFLEIIKHIFSVKGVVFVLSLDKQQLKSMIEKNYGYNIDFDGYFRRFITMSYTIPSAVRSYYINDNEEYLISSFIDNHLKKYDNSIFNVDCLKMLIKHYSPTLRDVKLFIRYIAIVVNPNTIIDREYTRTVFYFLIMLKLKNNDKYSEIIRNLNKEINDIKNAISYIMSEYEEIYPNPNNLKIVIRDLGLCLLYPVCETEKNKCIINLLKLDVSRFTDNMLSYHCPNKVPDFINIAKEIDSVGEEFF
jgi:hypothetical protein